MFSIPTILPFQIDEQSDSANHLGWFKRLLQFDGRRTTILTYLNWLVRFCSSAVWMGFS